MTYCGYKRLLGTTKVLVTVQRVKNVGPSRWTRLKNFMRL